MADQGIPIIGPILNRIIGTRNERFVKKYTQRVQGINQLEAQMRALTDEQLRGKLSEFRSRVEGGTKADDLMVEAFAVAREAMDRAVGIRNIFNPKAGFDISKLSAEMQGVYAQVKAGMDAMPVIVPRTFVPSKDEQQPPENAIADEAGEWLGCTYLIHGWMRADIPQALYEAVRELYPESRPPFRARPFDVQLIGGMVLTQGKIAEMRTGEGKTIVAPLATYLACIERLKVHVVTVNDYLVQRDRDWTAPFFRALGLTVGAIHPQHMQGEDVKRFMYRCDIVYGTTSEFGFDYLRDNMKDNEDQQVQRKRHFAIVDEVDSILIDEARTPLIISGQAHDSQPRYELADQLARHLVGKQKPWTDADEKVEKCKLLIKGLEGDIRQARDKSRIPEMKQRLSDAKSELPKLESARDKNTQYFEVKLERKQTHLTHEGVSEAQRVAQVGSFYVDENIDLPHLLEQSLRAHTVYELDKDYVVMNIPDQQTGRPEAAIVIVDANTGRPMIGRQWSDGLHQAIECKEKVKIKQETQTVATITIQNFFKMYKRLAGMTGTADTEAQEFHDIYGLDVVAIPTNKAVVRRDYDDMVFMTPKDKWTFITDEIKAFNDVGRPVLVGTTSVEKSEMLSKMLNQRHMIQHSVLNAKQHEREANVVENAGQLGAVMIATNMAGRGTDIKLGRFTREQLLEHWLKRNIAPATLTVNASDEELREQVYRKIAPHELGVNRRELENVPFAELELRLLRQWANKNTWEDAKKIDQMNAEGLRAALDKTGRFLLHNIRWFESIEDMGGLHVIGTERHEARRIDNQLRGRAGRQGDRGSSRFFVSLDDDLMKLFAGETTSRVLATLGMKEGDAIEHPMLSKSVERAQKKVEERNFHYRKTVLEYDEIMEHQRQSFYGMRQRVIEGRDVKGLILSFITSTVDDAVSEYLGADYPYVCCSEFAGAKLGGSIPHDRLRGREQAEIEKILVEEAKYDMRQTIDVTLGEYIPDTGSDVAVDFDTAGLAKWAKNRFDVDLDPAQLEAEGGSVRRRVQKLLIEKASASIEATDLSGLSGFLEPDYGARQLAQWFEEKLGIAASVDEIISASKEEAEEDESPVTKLLMKKVEEAYEKREIEYPVDYAMQATRMMSQMSRQDAAANLIGWANQRYKLGWNADIFKKSPAQVRDDLLAAASTFHRDNKLEEEIQAALVHKDEKSLDAYWKERFGRPLPESMRYMQQDEREGRIRARVESVLRSELLQFERMVVLKTADDAWRNHLHAMDQLRDSINYRAFSQNDPRIEYKREGSRMFTDMLEDVRGHVTQYVFKARIQPAPPPQMQQRPPMQQAPRPAGAPMMGNITGPGIDGPMMG